MKSKKERDAFVKNPANWEIKESTNFTRTLQLTYMGTSWIKIQHREWSAKYDHTLHKLIHEARWEDKGYYTINDLFACLNPTAKTTIIEEISALDNPKHKSDGPAIPSIIEIDRRKKHET